MHSEAVETSPADHVDADQDDVDRVGWSDEFTSFTCPRCEQALVKAALDDHPALACPDCRGVMLANAAFGALVRQRRAAFRGAEFTPRPIDLEQLSDPVSCPGCGRTMEVHPYYGPGNQIIDSCCRCNLVWIDSGELTAIERAPGLR
jgi:Zn-finger nucleic acid-binding protein